MTGARMLALAGALATACAPTSKEAAIQTGLAAGVAACDALIADPSIPAEPEARAWCARLVRGCRE